MLVFNVGCTDIFHGVCTGLPLSSYLPFNMERWGNVVQVTFTSKRGGVDIGWDFSFFNQFLNITGEGPILFGSFS